MLITYEPGAARIALSKLSVSRLNDADISAVALEVTFKVKTNMKEKKIPFCGCLAVG
jgi:hypothetical protein